MPRRSCLGAAPSVIVVWVVAITTSACAARTERTAEDVFETRVAEYMALRTYLVSKLGPLPLTADSATLRAHREALAAAIQARRAGAAGGSVFGARAAATITAALAHRLAEPDGKDLMAAVASVQPQDFDAASRGALTTAHGT